MDCSTCKWQTWGVLGVVTELVLFAVFDTVRPITCLCEPGPVLRSAIASQDRTASSSPL